MPFRNLAPLLWICVFLVGREVSLEYRASLRGYSSLLFQPSTPPVLSGTKQEMFGPTASFPFRCAIIPKAKRENTCRIWIASASHAEDSRTPVSKIFPVRLAETLNSRDSSVEILNGSRAGKTIDDNTRDFIENCRSWCPDVAILYQMSLDITKLSNLDVQSNGIEEPNRSNNSVASELPWPTRLVESTTLYELTKTNLSSRLTNQRILPDELSELASARFEGSVMQFINAVRDRGATPVLCTFAISHSKESELPNDYWYGVLRVNPNLSKAGWFATIARFNRLLRRIADREDVVLIDVDARTTGHTSYFRDFVHFSEAGHESVAKVIAESLNRAVSQHQRSLQTAVPNEL